MKYSYSKHNTMRDIEGFLFTEVLAVRDQTRFETQLEQASTSQNPVAAVIVTPFPVKMIAIFTLRVSGSLHP